MIFKQHSKNTKKLYKTYTRQYVCVIILNCIKYFQVTISNHFNPFYFLIENEYHPVNNINRYKEINII